jgi:hypothetical protein
MRIFTYNVDLELCRDTAAQAIADTEFVSDAGLFVFVISLATLTLLFCQLICEMNVMAYFGYQAYIII